MTNCTGCNTKIDVSFMSIRFIDGRFSDETIVAYYCHECFGQASDSTLRNSLKNHIFTAHGKCPYCNITIVPGEDFYYIRGYNEKGLLCSPSIDTYCYNFHIGIPLPKSNDAGVMGVWPAQLAQQQSQTVQQTFGNPQPLVVSPSVLKKLSGIFTKK